MFKYLIYEHGGLWHKNATSELLSENIKWLIISNEKNCMILEKLVDFGKKFEKSNKLCLNVGILTEQPN